jgi:hypothetical protein
VAGFDCSNEFIFCLEIGMCGLELIENRVFEIFDITTAFNMIEILIYAMDYL